MVSDVGSGLIRISKQGSVRTITVRNKQVPSVLVRGRKILQKRSGLGHWLKDTVDTNQRRMRMLVGSPSRFHSWVSLRALLDPMCAFYPAK